MQIEYEATFSNIKKGEMRKKLKDAVAVLKRQEFLQKRYTFRPPEGCGVEKAWLRVRDEGDKITMSIKSIDGDKIHNQKEIDLEVSSFDSAIIFLEALGCKKKSYQETKRELWMLDNVEICLDEWPFLEPFVEIEGKSEDAVKKAAEKLGFDYNDALFCCVSTLYCNKYGIPENIINNEIPEVTFQGNNPFEKLVAER